jgi:Ca2+:H+ antiporter
VIPWHDALRLGEKRRLTGVWRKTPTNKPFPLNIHQALGIIEIMTLARMAPLIHSAGPIVASVLLVLFWANPPGVVGVIALSLVLIGGVVSAVYHVEVIAAFVGRVLGAIILAVAVTIIEVTLIVSIMVESWEAAASLGRDTVFAAVMITTNGIVGLSVIAATLRSSTSSFNSEGSGAALGAIATIATLSLVVPTFSDGSIGPTFTTPKLLFVGVASLGVYCLFLYILTVRHREHFEDPSSPPTESLRVVPTQGKFVQSIIFLVVTLIVIIGLAQVLAPSIEDVVTGAGLPLTFVAVLIALVVLLPEGATAFRLARRGHLQSGFNIGYGSALASIGLTIPALVVVSLVLDIELELGLRDVDIVLFLLTLVVSTVTVASNRVTLFQGGLHMAIFFAFLFLSTNL